MIKDPNKFHRVKNTYPNENYRGAVVRIGGKTRSLGYGEYEPCVYVSGHKSYACGGHVCGDKLFFSQQYLEEDNAYYDGE